MPMFDFMQLGSNLLLSAAAARRALIRHTDGRSSALGAHSVQVTAPDQHGRGRQPGPSAVPRKSLLSRLVQVFQGSASSRVAPLPSPQLRMQKLRRTEVATFCAGLDRARTKPESLVQITGGPMVAETFKKDLSRSNYFLANRNGRALGEQINQLTNSPTEAQLASTANSILKHLGNDVELFKQVTQFAQQGGLSGLPDVQGSIDSPVKLNGRGVFVMDAAGGGRTDDSHKTYAVGLRRPGVAVVNVRYSNQNIDGVFAHHDGRMVLTDRSKSRLDLEFTVEVERDGTHRIVGNVRMGSVIVPAQPATA